MNPQVELWSTDYTDVEQISKLINKLDVAEIYNFAGHSHVGTSLLPSFERDNNIIRSINTIAESALNSRKKNEIKIYQASSSEIFANSFSKPQDETTIPLPLSPYGIAKLEAQRLSKKYVEKEGLFISNGIAFNHESEFRGYQFVTRKITSSIAKIVTGKIEKFELGNIDARRDWGYAGDYVQAMWKILQEKSPEDYVLSTGIMHSVREFLNEALNAAGLDSNLENYVIFNSNMNRQEYPIELCGNSTKAKIQLNWQPKTSFRELVQRMIENDLRIEKAQLASKQNLE